MSKILLALSLLGAKSLISDKTPLDERLKILAPLFKPKLNDLIELEAAEVQARTKTSDPQQLSGGITVMPPKGFCFTIQRSKDVPDIRVCEEKQVRFQLSDLDKNGRLNWTVFTGDGDFSGTPVSWPSPYRMGTVVAESQPFPGPSQAVYLKSCEPMHSKNFGRRIYLHFFHGDTWVISLPEKDKLAEQPKRPKPFLFIQQNVDNGGFVKLASKDKKDKNTKGKHGGEGEKEEAKEPEAEKEAPPPAAEEHASKPEGEGGEGGESEEGEKKAKKKREHHVDIDSVVINSSWQMHPRGAYMMSADHVATRGSHPPGIQGECRYKYQEDEKDPLSGRIECVNIDGFKWIYMPLTCISALHD